MIKIEFTNGKPSLEFPEAETIKEAVELAIARKIRLRYVYLFRADLSNANLDGAHLFKADLRGARLYGARLRGARLYGSDLRSADLRGARLRGACLRDADLRSAALNNADLREVDLDYSAWPLWCGSLTARINKRIFCQLLYHVVRAGQSVEDEEVRKFLDLPEVINLANQFHRVKECGEIKGAKK